MSKYSFIYSILAANDELFIHAFPPPSLSLQEGISLLHYSVLQDRPEIVIYLSNSPDCLLTPQDKVLYTCHLNHTLSHTPIRTMATPLYTWPVSMAATEWCSTF